MLRTFRSGSGRSRVDLSMGTSTLRALLKRIEREDPTGLLFDGSTYYQVMVLRQHLAENQLDGMVHWDNAGRIFRGPDATDSGEVLYSFEEPPPWQRPSSSRRWVEAAGELGWGWVVAIIWMTVWVGEVIDTHDQTFRDVSLVIVTVSAGTVLTLITLIFHRKRIEDAKSEERVASATRWLKDHPRKGKSWREE